MTTDERFKKLLAAPVEQLELIDSVLAGATSLQREDGPLLLGMKSAARHLGVSRVTLWRMIKAGCLERVEVLPGSFRVRRRDLDAIASKRRLRTESNPEHPTSSKRSPHRASRSNLLSKFKL
jgi:hypothetical protein